MPDLYGESVVLLIEAARREGYDRGFVDGFMEMAAKTDKILDETLPQNDEQKPVKEPYIGLDGGWK